MSDVICPMSDVRNQLEVCDGAWQSRNSVDANDSRATIRDRCFGKGEEKARMLKTFADPAAADAL